MEIKTEIKMVEPGSKIHSEEVTEKTKYEPHGARVLVAVCQNPLFEKIKKSGLIVPKDYDLNMNFMLFGKIVATGPGIVGFRVGDYVEFRWDKFTQQQSVMNLLENHEWDKNITVILTGDDILAKLTFPTGKEPMLVDKNQKF